MKFPGRQIPGLTLLAATGAGAAVGWVCGLVPVWPVARLVMASVMGAAGRLVAP